MKFVIFDLTLNVNLLYGSFFSFSLCRHFVLESGVPVRLTLEPGDCHEEDNTIDDADVPELTVSVN